MAMWPQGSDNTGKAVVMHVEAVQGDITAGSVGGSLVANLHIWQVRDGRTPLVRVGPGIAAIGEPTARDG